MLRRSNWGSFIVTTAVAACFVIVTGCTKYASEDDLRNLEESRKAAVAAEKERDKLKGEVRKLEQELKTWQDSLVSVQAEFEKIKSR